MPTFSKRQQGINEVKVREKMIKVMWLKPQPVFCSSVFAPCAVHGMVLGTNPLLTADQGQNQDCRTMGVPQIICAFDLKQLTTV